MQTITVPKLSIISITLPCQRQNDLLRTLYNFLKATLFRQIVTVILVGEILLCGYFFGAPAALILALTVGLSASLIFLALSHIPPDMQHNADPDQEISDLQTRLIAQEKMAGIGFLSAGIMHEIKNPLNLINNFSATTTEIVQELKEAMAPNIEQAEAAQKELVEGLFNEIVSNCQKIEEHGKRASSIVDNILMQAHTAKIDKTTLDVNALLDEFVTLSFQGMRSKENPVNVKIDKSFDKDLPLIIANPQNIGRVFLNIANNGLYAAIEKFNKGTGDARPIATLSVSTQQDKDFVIIKIKDNGSGIPDSLRAKIFQPFFTTKPAGIGTGLGLSLCYDIIVNEHQGKLDINSTPGEFTEFVITLPKSEHK